MDVRLHMAGIVVGTVLGATLPGERALAAPTLGTVGTHEVAEEDFVYARADTLELKAHSYRPQPYRPDAGAGLTPAIIDVHGGAWSSGDRMQGQLYDRALASAGLYVLAIDFRQAPAQRHPAASQDVAAAVRYLRAHAARLRIDVAKLGVVGSSSGGHLAMLAGITPNAAAFKGTSIATTDATFETNTADASVSYVIALWPVSDPAYRYSYAKSVNRAELVRSHDAFFGSEEQMKAASVPRMLRAKEAEQTPSLLVVQAGNDANIPRPMTFDLVAAYQEAGGQLDYLFYPGQPHAFGHRASADSSDLWRAMRDFIARQLAGTNEQNQDSR